MISDHHHFQHWYWRTDGQHQDLQVCFADKYVINPAATADHILQSFEAIKKVFPRQSLRGGSHNSHSSQGTSPQPSLLHLNMEQDNYLSNKGKITSRYLPSRDSRWISRNLMTRARSCRRRPGTWRCGWRTRPHCRELAIQRVFPGELQAWWGGGEGGSWWPAGRPAVSSAAGGTTAGCGAVTPKPSSV